MYQVAGFPADLLCTRSDDRGCRSRGHRIHSSGDHILFDQGADARTWTFRDGTLEGKYGARDLAQSGRMFGKLHRSRERPNAHRIRGGICSAPAWTCVTQSPGKTFSGIPKNKIDVRTLLGYTGREHGTDRPNTRAIDGESRGISSPVWCWRDSLTERGNRGVAMGGERSGECGIVARQIGVAVGRGMSCDWPGLRARRNLAVSRRRREEPGVRPTSFFLKFDALWAPQANPERNPWMAENDNSLISCPEKRARSDNWACAFFRERRRPRRHLHKSRRGRRRSRKNAHAPTIHSPAIGLN